METGSVENGPAFHGLPKFFVSEREGCVFVTYPLVFPTSIGLSISGHSPEDNRKIIIIGGDPHATIGSLHGFRIFGYTGEISIIIDN